jgi:hypothetical protein
MYRLSLIVTDVGLLLAGSASAGPGPSSGVLPRTGTVRRRAGAEMKEE